MTDNDYRLEDRPESQKRKEGRPNYALRRMKFAIAVIGLVVSVTLMLTWRDSGNMAGALLVEGVYLATACGWWCGFASRDDGLRGVTDEGDSARIGISVRRSGQGVDTKKMTSGDRAVAARAVGRWRARRGRSW